MLQIRRSSSIISEYISLRLRKGPAVSNLVNFQVIEDAYYYAEITFAFNSEFLMFLQDTVVSYTFDYTLNIDQISPNSDIGLCDTSK